jgi:hypothetical protein
MMGRLAAMLLESLLLSAGYHHRLLNHNTIGVFVACNPGNACDFWFGRCRLSNSVKSGAMSAASRPQHSSSPSIMGQVLILQKR